VSEEIPNGPLLARPVLELVSLVDVHDDVFSDDAEHANSESQEELEVPRIHDAPVTHSPSEVQNDEYSLTVDFEAFASAREMSPTQHFDAHVDVQTSPQADPLIVRSIPDDTATFLEMERLAQSMADTTGTDVNCDKILPVYDSHTNPNVQHDLDLWMRVRDYDKANAEAPFIPVLSRKQKAHVKKNLQIGKPSTYKTRSQGGSNSGTQ